jgi:ribosomal protein L37AE/L43A
MAIFRITSQTRRPELAKRSIRYIVHRRSREQAPRTRALYDQYGLSDKDTAYNRIDRVGEWATCFRTVISPDPVREDGLRDLDLRALTEATMQQLRLRLKDQLFSYFAATHIDHTDNRHIHVLLFLTKNRLSKADLKALRQAATENAREQRRLLDRGQEEAAGKQQGRFAAREQSNFRPKGTPRPGEQVRGHSDRMGAAPRRNPSCLGCGFSTEMHRLTKTLFRCPSCGRIVENNGISVQVVREPTLTLAFGGEVGTL